jgi:hypothetical protein
VKLLVEKGADVNAQGGHFGNALQVASEGGHEAIVKLLIVRLDCVVVLRQTVQGAS